MLTDHQVAEAIESIYNETDTYGRHIKITIELGLSDGEPFVDYTVEDLDDSSISTGDFALDSLKEALVQISHDLQIPEEDFK